jgi:tubulin-folding cofactor B
LEVETKLLSDFGASEHNLLHVIDMDPAKYVASTQSGEVVEPFVLSAEKEAARAEVMKLAKEQKAIADDQKLLRVALGDRCQISSPTNPSDAPRVGSVAFVGPVHWATGLWVGVKFDEALGKNDGSVKGVRYFQCEDNHGSFVKPTAVSPIIPIHTHTHNGCCADH